MRYETPADLRAEEEISAVVVAKLGLERAPKMPLHYVLDRAAIRAGAITSFFEVKDRNGWKFGDGDGLYLSLFKVLKGRHVQEVTGKRCQLVVRFVDGDIWWCPLASYDTAHGVFWFGRNDRDEDEPCVVYRWDVFKRVA